MPRGRHRKGFDRERQKDVLEHIGMALVYFGVTAIIVLSVLRYLVQHTDMFQIGCR